MKTRIRIAFGGFLFVCIAAVLCSLDKVAVRGHAMPVTVQDVTLQVTVSKPRIEHNPAENFCKLFLPMKLSLTNKSDESVLVLRSAVQIIGVRVATSEANLESRNFVADSQQLPSFVQRDLLNLKHLTEKTTEIVEPEERYDWNMDYWISLPRNDPNSSSVCEPSSQRSASLGELWIEVDLAFFPMNSMPAKGAELRRKWKDKGGLLLGTMTTKPVEVSFLNK